MQVKSQNRFAQDASVWPEGNDQERVVTNKPAKVPHFLCRAQSPDEPGNRIAGQPNAIHDNQNEMPLPDQKITDDTERAGRDKPAKRRKKAFLPLSPHLHKMMIGSGRTEQPSRHEPPSWVQETIAEDRALERQRVFKGLAIAACLVLASGVGLTVTAMEFKSSKNKLPTTWNSSLAALLPSFEPATPQQMKRLPVIGAPSPDTSSAQAAQPAPALTKIGSVKLTVSDASGAAQTPIALPLKAESGTSEPPIAVKLTGLPEKAELSAGTRRQDAAWILKPAELNDLHVTLPDTASATVKVTVAAIETETGDLAAPMQEMTITVDPKIVVVEPAALPAPTSRNYSSESGTKTNYSTGKDALAMRTRGDETLALGDVTGARGFYKKALKMGDVASAARIGRTYDPVVYQAVGVHGLRPDPKLAESWYRHAISEGDASAREDLNRLTQRLGQ